MRRSLHLTLVALLVPVLTQAQLKSSNSARIENAVSAAPPSIGAHAAIYDWPASGQGDPIQIRAGTNGWTCYTDLPFTEGNDPMCLDETWNEVLKAQLHKQLPKITRVGVGYMAGHGGGHGSNVDPWASAPTPTNEWGYDPPHLMIVVPDAKVLKGLPTKRVASGPYVMFAGTPYAHLMIPVAGGADPKK